FFTPKLTVHPKPSFILGHVANRSIGSVERSKVVDYRLVTRSALGFIDQYLSKAAFLGKQGSQGIRYRLFIPPHRELSEALLSLSKLPDGHHWLESWKPRPQFVRIPLRRALQSCCCHVIRHLPDAEFARKNMPNSLMTQCLTSVARYSFL